MPLSELPIALRLLVSSARGLSSDREALTAASLGQFALAWLALCEDEGFDPEFLWPGGGLPKSQPAIHLAQSSKQLLDTVLILSNSPTAEQRFGLAAQAVHQWAELCLDFGIAPMACLARARGPREAPRASAHNDLDFLRG